MPCATPWTPSRRSAGDDAQSNRPARAGSGQFGATRDRRRIDDRDAVASKAEAAANFFLTQNPVDRRPGRSCQTSQVLLRERYHRARGALTIELGDLDQAPADTGLHRHVKRLLQP